MPGNTNKAFLKGEQALQRNTPRFQDPLPPGPGPTDDDPDDEDGDGDQEASYIITVLSELPQRLL